MKKHLTKFLLTLALAAIGGANLFATKLYATYGTPANQGSWDSETNTYTWTASYSNLMTLFEFPNGELANYTSIHLSTSGYTQPYRICLMKGGTLVATVAFYSAGQKDIDFATNTDTKDVDLSTITHISFGGKEYNESNGTHSIVLSTAYLEAPISFSFNDEGIALIDPSDISAPSPLTYDEETGVLTSNGSGTFSVSLNQEDFSNVTLIELLRSGDDVVQTLKITDADNGVLNTWYSSKYELNFETAYQAKASKITKLEWNCNKSGTMTITGIRITANVFAVSNPHLTPLTAAMFNNSYCEYNIGTAQGQGSTIYGNGNVEGDKYADLTEYDELRITGTPGQKVGLRLNWATTKDQPEQTLDENGYTSFDLRGYATKQLNAIKFPWNGQTGAITSMTCYKETTTSPYNYILTGSGVVTAATTAALADETATSIDATGLTKATTLETANPNCLIVAAAGKVDNEQNVIVADVCANLVLTDSKPFAAPADFTATTASFTKTIGAARAATLLLPFDAELPTGVTAYNLTVAAGDEVTATPAASIEANKPVLINADAGNYTFTATSASVAKTEDGAQENALMGGIYADGYVPAGSYVLQAGASGVGFYKVSTDNTIKIQPFHAYLTPAAGGSKPEHLRIVWSTTAIEQVAVPEVEKASPSYDLMGRRVAQPGRGIYIVGGRKVVKY